MASESKRRRPVSDAPGKVPVARCTERVPERLCGGLKGEQRPVCRRDEGHSGKHRSQRRLRGVGTTLWEWRSQPEEPTVSTQPTFIEPEIVVRQWAPKKSHGKCKCEGLKHKCSRYRGLLRL